MSQRARLALLLLLAAPLGASADFHLDPPDCSADTGGGDAGVPPLHNTPESGTF